MRKTNKCIHSIIFRIIHSLQIFVNHIFLTNNKKTNQKENTPSYVIINHKYSEGKVKYQILNLTGDKHNASWHSSEELQQIPIIQYYRKRINMRQKNISIIPDEKIKNPLSVTNSFGPPEGVQEDNDFFSSFINSKPVFTNEYSLKKFGAEAVKVVSSDLDISSEKSDDKETNEQNSNPLKQQQFMISCDKETIFISPSCLECYDQNLFLQICEKGNENK